MYGWVAAVVVCGVAIPYCILSALFLRKPTWIWKKKKFTSALNCRHISHRGGAGENVENTMAAFQFAVESGAKHRHMLEMDVRLTRDSRVVVIHDADLTRLAGLEQKVSDLLYSDLPTLLPRQLLHFDSSHRLEVSEDTPRHVPLLEDVFKAFPHTPINVDLKDESEELMRLVHELVSRYRREDLTVWGSFSERTAKRLYEMNPKVPLFTSGLGVLSVVAGYHLGYLPFMRLRESAFEVPMMSRVPAGASRLMTCLMRVVSALLLRKGLVTHLRKRGISTYAWVLNHEEDFEKVFKLGVMGVMTDYPSRLARWLDQRMDGEGRSGAEGARLAEPSSADVLLPDRRSE